tara:strand:- start:174 stop:1157 length:984 start_codon:yes stop_codon:yes gene_type:complete
MKNKLLTLASMLAAFNLNAIELGPTGSGLEMSGFADYSVSSQDGTTKPIQTAQVELNFDMSRGPVSFALDLDFYGSQGTTGSYNGDDGNVTSGTTGGNLEEAVVTYAFNDNLSVSVGRMLSYLGFEAYDPTNMYQFSYAYDYATGGGQDIYDAYADGMSVDYAGDVFSIGIWTDLAEQSSFEYAFAYTGVENLTVKAIFADYGDNADEIYTLWASYQIGNLLLGVEFAEDDKVDPAAATATNYKDDDIEAFLFMANYAITDSAAITLRYSEADYTDTGATVTVDKFTVSPSYMFTDDLAGLVEFSSYDVIGGAEPDDLFAVELIYTF